MSNNRYIKILTEQTRTTKYKNLIYDLDRENKLEDILINIFLEGKSLTPFWLSMLLDWMMQVMDMEPDERYGNINTSSLSRIYIMGTTGLEYNATWLKNFKDCDEKYSRWFTREFI